MTPIATQMDRDAVGAGLLSGHRGGDHARFGSTTRLPDGCDSFRMLSEVGLIRQQARRGVYDGAIRAVHDLRK